MKKNNIKINFIGTCFDLSNEGKGVVKYNSIVGFVDYLLPGEKAEIEITYLKKDIFYGRVIRLIEESQQRSKPTCPYFKECGGCSIMHLSYQGQLEYKQKKVQECMKRIGGLNVNVLPTLGMEKPYSYRNKIQMPIKLSKNNKIVSGFYKEKSHDIVPIEKCAIENKKADKILSSIKLLMKKYRILPYDEDRRSGIIRHVLIRTSFHYEEIMVVFVTNIDAFPGRNDFIKELKKMNPEITTIVQNINSRNTNVILGEKERILSGKGFIKDILCGVEFKISAKSFYQVNPIQTEKLYSLAISLADIKPTDLVLDAYCGIGTIGLIASAKAKSVIGVEIVKEAVIDAINNAKNNNINNAYFYQGDAGKFIVEQYQQGIKFDVVIMDPPRKGSDEAFLSTLIKTKPSKIVYVSCDPATLARDLKYLSKAYEIKIVQPVDMFPHTSHIETVVLLSHRKADDYVEMDINNDEFPITSAEMKATYLDIKDYVMKKYNVKISSLEVAQMKQKYGIIERDNYKKKKDNSKYLQPKCTKEKEAYILEAFKFYKMI